MKKILGLLVALMASVSMFAKTYQQDIVSAYDTVVFDWANNIGSITYEGSVEEKTVYTQTNTISTACIAISYSYLSKGTYSYAELSVADGFKTGDVVDIDFCYSNSAEKQTRVAMYDVNDNKLAESDLAINARLQDGMSNFQYQLTSDMASIRVARSGGSTIYITRLQVIRTEPTYNVTANAIPSYAGTVDVTYNEDHTQATLTATPNDGYHFAGWSDGITINPRTIILTSDLSLTANFAQSGSSTNYVLDFTTQGTSINDWIINYATLNESNTNEDAGKYVYDIQGGIESESYLVSEPNVIFRVKNGSDKQKAFVIYPGQGYEFGGKYGIICINGTSVGDRIRITCAAKGSTNASFEDGEGVYPKNAITITEDLSLPGKKTGAEGEDEHGFSWREIEFESLGGDVEIKEFAGGVRVKRVEVEESGITTPTYTITADASPSNAGNVYVNYNAEHTQATMTATANYGYRFDHWNDGNTQNPRTVMLTQDVTYTAYFQQYSVDPTQPRLWPMMMDDVTYGLNEQYVVNDFRQDSVERWLQIWEHTYLPVEAAGLNFYGNTEGYLALTVENMGWSGGGLYLEGSSMQIGEALRQEIMNNPSDYYLHLAIKSPDNGSHAFYLFGNDAATLEMGNNAPYFSSYIESYNFTRDGEWHEFYISMASYANVLSIQATTNDYIFVFLSQGVQGVQLNLDAVYFCNTAYKNNQTTPPVEENYTVTTNVHPIDAGEVQMQSGSNWAVLTATGNTGYHFKRWSDGNLDNPRYVELTQDTTFTALFELDVLEVTYIGMDGRVLGVESVQYGSQARQRGVDTDEFGYTLVGWSEDLSYVTTDMTVTAIYQRDAVNGFYYIYDRDAKTAVLDHEGNSYANIRKLNVPNNFIYRGIKFAVVAVGANAFENCDRLTEVVLPGNVENVEEYAFSGCSDMIHLTMSANLRSIADYAFNGCKRLEDITVYAQRVPDLTATSFNAIGNKKYVNVYVPDNRVNNYKRDEYWSEFNIVVKSADAIEGEVTDVTVEPEETTAQFTWPTDNSAGSYTIEITKDGIVFCTLIFNANGQLTGIAFAPGRNGNEAPMATLLANGGMQFTVTGLDAGTSYAYTVTTKDTQERVIATFEGSFETSGSMEDGIMDIQSGAAPQKVLHNGQIYILRGEKVFTLQGVEVK